MGRPRQKRGLVDNLYESGGYYSWRDPRDGKTHGLGRDKAAAIREAKAANAIAYTENTSLTNKLRGGISFEEFAPLIEESLDNANQRAANTVKSHRSIIKACSLAFGATPISAITTAQVDALLRERVALGQDRTAQAFRSFLATAFRIAEARGLIERGKNPATITERIHVETKRQRLTLESFLAIYSASLSLDPWVAHAMELALVTGQRESDIAAAMFRQEDGATCWVEGDVLKVIQGKTGAPVEIGLGLRLDCVGWSVGDVIKRCRDNVVSKYLIHHTKRRTMSAPGDPVHPNTISKGFRRARVKAGVALDAKNPPTFHEIRSLAKRLYDKQGGVNTKDLLGHKTDRMANEYADPRGIEWKRVA